VTLTFELPAPTITAASPASGPLAGGGNLVITGSNFTGASAVAVGGTPCASFSVDSATQITCVLPAGTAGSADVQVTTAGGSATLPAAYTYAAAPTLTMVSPASGPLAGGGNLVITGTAFTGATAVTVGGTACASFSVDSATQITCVLPAGTAGSADVQVTTPEGSATLPAAYTYTAAPTPPTPRPPTTPAPGAIKHLRTLGRNQSIHVNFAPPTAVVGTKMSYQISTNSGRTWHALGTKNGRNRTRTGTVSRLSNGVTYSVKVRAVDSGGTGPASKLSTALPNAPKLGDVRTAPASEVRIPTHPASYDGTRKYTKALDTSHNGTWAHPLANLGTRQLTVGEAVALTNGSLFAFNSPALTKAAKAAVKDLVGHLRLAQGVSCEGYADYGNVASHEKSLSLERALAICKALIGYGAHVKITAHGYGRQRPVVIGGTPRSRAGNRRVVVIVTR
jgi:outer membrane protein OmpA-like peptidoglycan-associated protein